MSLTRPAQEVLAAACAAVVAFGIVAAARFTPAPELPTAPGSSSPTSGVTPTGTPPISTTPDVSTSTRAPADPRGRQGGAATATATPTDQPR